MRLCGISDSTSQHPSRCVLTERWEKRAEQLAKSTEKCSRRLRIDPGQTRGRRPNSSTAHGLVPLAPSVRSTQSFELNRSDPTLPPFSPCSLVGAGRMHPPPPPQTNERDSVKSAAAKRWATAIAEAAAEVAQSLPFSTSRSPVSILAALNAPAHPDFRSFPPVLTQRRQGAHFDQPMRVLQQQGPLAGLGSGLGLGIWVAMGIQGSG